MNNTEKSMEKLVALCKNRGFVFPGSEIYGGLANSWDYGPLGVEMKNNIKKAWVKKFIQESPYNVSIESALIMNPRVWDASGHTSNFNDPQIDCKACKSRFRADNLANAFYAEHGIDADADGMSIEDLNALFTEHDIRCPSCGKRDFTAVRKFNMMLRTFLGASDDSAVEAFLRPETAQGMFVNFKNVARTSRKKLPFGIGQVGKSFRNEITPGNFIFRTREFEQMELEFFCRPGTELEWFDYWRAFCQNWLLGLGVQAENLRMSDHALEKLSHYSNATTDIQFRFPFGWEELWGIASRTDFDLKQHSEHSGETLEYFDPETNEKFIPYCIEPAVGVDRIMLTLLVDAYDEEVVDAEKNDARVVLRLHPAIAPFKCAVLPLSKKLGEPAMAVWQSLSAQFMCDYDETGSIGKRYRRQDEVGTPLCITYDFESETDGCVTIRDRDTMDQVRLPIAELEGYIRGKIAF